MDATTKDTLEAVFSLLNNRIERLCAYHDSVHPQAVTTRAEIFDTLKDLKLARGRIGPLLTAHLDPVRPQTEYPTGKVAPPRETSAILAGVPRSQLILPTEHGDVPVEVNAAGGRQSYTGRRFDLVPARAIAAVAGVLFTGAKRHGEENWRKIPLKDNVNHAIGHLFLHLEGDTSEHHLANAACRALFALDLEQTAKAEQK